MLCQFAVAFLIACKDYGAASAGSVFACIRMQLPNAKPKEKYVYYLTQQFPSRPTGDFASLKGLSQ